ncbi:integral membrane protein [Streptomyces albidoflavus]|nr:integral membrane protein [Streptomyces albidoflavus]
MKRFPAVLGIQLLSGLIVAIPVALMALFMVLTMVALLSRGDAGPWLVLMPFLFLGVAALAVWLGIRLALATPAAVFEGQGPVGALRRSVRLVRDNWWRTFGLLLLAALMAMGLSLALQILTGAFQSPADSLVVDNTDTGWFGSAEVRALLADILVGSVIGLLVGSVVQIVGMTLTHLTAALVYVDLRIRKEGLADALIGEVGQGAPGPQAPPATGQGG